MAVEKVYDPRHWELTRDEKEGHRDYVIEHRVQTNDIEDGPFTVMLAAGLPAIGSTWVFGNDNDPWAFCTPYMKVSRVKGLRDAEPSKYWDVEQRFTTRPMNRCQDLAIEDPLLEPMRISGSFVKYLEEATHDYEGNPFLTSSLEPIKGAIVEFDANRPTVVIGQNVANLELDVFSAMIDHVNDAPLWGLGSRCIKLSNAPWERKYFGLCNVYYTRTLEFDIRYDTFDRETFDEGYMVLHGHWDDATGDWEVTDVAEGVPADATNPAHFIQRKDVNNENIKGFLDGEGKPLYSLSGTGTGEPVIIPIRKYEESNFLLLGIPATL